MKNNLNIITLNIPYPPDYGGMIDTFYRIKALHTLGVKIHLHCLEYGRKHSPELESLCETVEYYKRKSVLLRHFSLFPYIVSSRKSGRLLKNLKRNDYPILFDGLHTTFYLNHPSLSDRKKFIRAHNIEHHYYKSLSNYEPNLIKKLYFFIESLKLKRYEKVLGNIKCIFAISESDHIYFERKYQNSVFLAPYHPFNESESLPGFGDYILYHADLSVNENTLVAESLISDIFSKISYPCIIAGKNPDEKLLARASVYPNIQVIPNPDKEEMNRLIHNAHIHILKALTTNGFKIKLLISLCAGRHCLINSLMSESEHLRNLCHIAESNEEFIYMINILMRKEFSEGMIMERNKILAGKYNNINNTRKIIDIIFKDP